MRGTAGTVRLVQLLGSVRAFEFMAFAGNARQRDGHQQQGK
jgi:hypothetical protein